MIPKNITRQHVIKAVEEVKTCGIPPGRGSKRYLLQYAGEYYPPKYVISLANRHANGKELNPSEFGGGQESNCFLRRLGFKILEIRHPAPTGHMAREEAVYSARAHNERCPRCKETIRLMLERTYSRVDVGHKIDIGVLPDAFAGSAHYQRLKGIYEALQCHRGFREFVKARSLTDCDFFIPEPGFILEFDESQHFTLPRKIALQLYPDDLRLGFDRDRWIDLCQRSNAKDNDPPYRDEQRAWYDTLRDFVPSIAGLQPTARMFAGDGEWCSLKPDNALDLKRFRGFLGERLVQWEVDVREEADPFLARVIIADEWDGNPCEASKLLKTVYERWPWDKQVKLMMTCGGFIQFDWPKSVSRLEIGDNKYPNTEAIATLIAEADKSVTTVLNEALSRKLSQVTDYVTLGVDSYKAKISMTQYYIGEPHVELVCVVDLRNGRRYWTGKSYPAPAQQNGLVRITDMNTHFINLADIGRMMVLGCHDLTMFNPRSQNAKGWRQSANIEFKELARRYRPICVLQHPHTTVKLRTWLNAWNGVTRALPSVRQYAGAGRYCEPDRERSERDAIDGILRSTKRGHTIDFVVQKR